MLALGSWSPRTLLLVLTLEAFGGALLPYAGRLVSRYGSTS
jgi:hypothetical protein